MYPVSEQLLNFNRSGQTLVPEGFVIHDTDDPGATAQNEHDYFNSGNRQASAHYFVDWTQIIRTVPEDEVAWHAGTTANHKYLSVEMCVPGTHDQVKFQEIWNRTVWLVADAFVRYGWETGPGLWSHAGISNMYHETDHQDPIAYFAEYGKTFADFVAEVDAMIIQIKNEKEGTTVDKAILIFSQDDLPTAKRLQGKIGNCAVFFRNADATAPIDVKAAKQLFVVGGAGSVGHPNEVLLQGADWFKTVDAVAKYLG